MNQNDHIKGDQILAYLLKSLNDTERETIDHHLAYCPVCRSRVDEAEIQHRRVRNAIRAEITGVKVPSSLSFSKAASQLERRTWSRLQFRLATTIPVVTAVIGVILALAGFLDTLGDWSSMGIPPTPKSAFPALACFFLMFVSMDQFDRSFSIRPRFILTVLLAVFLWIGTFFVGLMNILVITDLVTMGFLVLGGNPETATFIAILTAFLTAMGYIVVVIGGAEYHYKHLGQPGSWKLFTWTLVIQLFIMILPYFV
jgi:hypothetical protein